MNQLSYLYDSLSSDESGKLIGGFSDVYASDISIGESIPNNCKGGNCKQGCRGKKTKRERNKPIPNGNCGAGKNCVKGCGGIIE